MNWTNLDLLIGEVSFGVNRISGIYGKTKWRPTYYVRAEEAGVGSDPKIYQDDIELHRDLGCEIWSNELFVGQAENVRKSGQWRQIRACSHYLQHFDSPDCPSAYHMPRLCTFGSSVNVAIQIALDIKNFDEVYLIGCDMGYMNNRVNHFDEKYTIGVGAMRDARYNELDILAAHMICARTYPNRIFNATIGGSLEIYKRVDYEDLFMVNVVDGHGMISKVKKEDEKCVTG